MQEVYNAQSTQVMSQNEVSKVLRNTYFLLGLTLAFSTLSAGIAMASGIGHGLGLVMSLVAMGLIWFVLPRTANSSAGLAIVFAFTGLIGAGLGPLVSRYLAMDNGA